MSVLLIGTLDTKGVEFALSATCWPVAGLRMLVPDAGVLGRPPFAPDVAARTHLRRRGQQSRQACSNAGDRGRAIEAAARAWPRLAARTVRGAGKWTGCSAWAARREPPSPPPPCGPALRRAQADGQHPGQRPGPALTSASATS